VNVKLRKAILNNSIIKNNFDVKTNATLSVISSNSSFNLSYDNNGPIIQQKLIELNGEYLTPIKINSSAIIKINDDCRCEKIIIDSIENPSIYFIGDISRVKILEIKCPCNITSPFTREFKGYEFSPIIDLNFNNNIPGSLVSFTGNMSASTINVNSFTKLRLKGKFNNLTIKPELENIELRLCGDTKITSINISSNTLVTCEKEVFDKLKDPDQTPGRGHNMLIVDKTSYILNFINGKAFLSIIISEPGDYSITSSLYLNNDNILIGENDIHVSS